MNESMNQTTLAKTSDLGFTLRRFNVKKYKDK